MNKPIRTILFFIAICFFITPHCFSQTITARLQQAFRQFEADPQLKNAISSLCVIDAKTGKILFEKNARIGLAPASTQKIITAATAFDLLGKDFRYKTMLRFDEKPVVISNDRLINRLYIDGSGDPTLGSFRFASENKNQFLDSILYYVRKQGIETLEQGIMPVLDHFESNPIPDGWIWQDIGNYYGAAHWAVNWNENQFDVILRSPGGIGERVEITGYQPRLPTHFLSSEVMAADKGTGDNAYIYLPLMDEPWRITGTIPMGEKAFKISGAIPDPAFVLADTLKNYLTANGVAVMGKPQTIHISDPEHARPPMYGPILFTHYSPSLDTIIYWFLRKSINLYGEALAKSIAFEKNGYGSTGNGIKIIQDWWKAVGIEPTELNMSDGSGLSPLNRVTTHAQVTILKYAKTRPWFSSFYNALPEYNGMKLKSGTISDVKGFCGYHTAKNGTEYIVAFLVNNYNGKSSTLVNKMYQVLDVLK